MAQPAIYNSEKAEKFLKILSTTPRGLHNICKELKLGPVTIYDWIDADHDDFANKYARAREMQADLLADEIIGIADDGTNDTKIIYDRSGNQQEVENTEWTRRSQLRVDARKWVAAKLKPKRYGDKLDVESRVHIEQPLFPDEKNNSDK